LGAMADYLDEAESGANTHIHPDSRAESNILA
jgi:hypothetical protein